MARYKLQANGEVVLSLSAAECKGLAILSGEGAKHLFADELTARGVGDRRQQTAARRAWQALLYVDSELRELEFGRKDADAC